MAYRNSFAEFLKTRDTSFSVRKDNREDRQEFKTGRSWFVINVTINIMKKRVGVELYMYRDPLKNAIRALEGDRVAIEQEIGDQLEWQELPGRKASKITLYRYNVDITEDNQYPIIHEWMLDKMQRFRRAFVPRVKMLNSDADDLPSEQMADEHL